jgi:hypothetical protein
VWRQLWRVVGSADVICLVTDVRNPLYHIPPSLYHEVTQELKKPLVIILNKADLVSSDHVEAWVRFLRGHFPSNTQFVPFTASGAYLGDLPKPSARYAASSSSSSSPLSSSSSSLSNPPSLCMRQLCTSIYWCGSVGALIVCRCGSVGVW